MQTKHEFLRRTAAVIAAFFTLTFTGCGQTPESPGSLPVSGVVSETTAQSGQETAGVSEGGSFTIHFIDVGQADSALVTCDGHSMLIDGGNADDSNLVYSVLQRETEGHLDYVVGTHAHEDHIGGLSGAFEADTADVTFCPVTEYDSKAFRNFKARADEKGGGITVPAVGDTFTLGEASITVVAVNSVLEDTNNMVTNGKAVDKMADLAMASLEWWNYCDDKDDYSCGLCISSDDFHEEISSESASILSGLKYNYDDKVTDFHKNYLLNEGRAKNLDSNIYKKREPYVDKLEYEFSKTGGIDFYSGELYLNAIGDVVSGCDLSYESQKKYRFGNVMDEKWLENIRSSKLCIEENS